jgi:hypothetical protein
VVPDQWEGIPRRGKRARWIQVSYRFGAGFALKGRTKPPTAHFRAGVRTFFGGRNARLAGSRFAASLTWLKAVLLELRQIVHMNWQEMWSGDGPRP